MKPGDFHARCSLRKFVAERKLSVEEIRDAKERGYPRTFKALVSERRDPEKGRNGRWEIGLPACGGFETADREAFAAHMLTEHGRGRDYARGHNEAFALSIRRPWSPPRIPAAGGALPKDAEKALEHCPSCGLAAEVRSNAGDLWMREHLQGCALAVAGISVSADDDPLPLPAAARPSVCDVSVWVADSRQVFYCAGGCDGTTHRFERKA